MIFAVTENNLHFAHNIASVLEHKLYKIKKQKNQQLKKVFDLTTKLGTV